MPHKTLTTVSILQTESDDENGVATSQHTSRFHWDPAFGGQWPMVCKLKCMSTTRNGDERRNKLTENGEGSTKRLSSTKIWNLQGMCALRHGRATEQAEQSSDEG